MSIAGRTVVLVPLGAKLAGCGSAYEGEGEGEPGCPGDPSASARTDGAICYRSSQNESHTHTFQIAAASFESPPADGASGDTSEAGGHTHEVDVTADQLGALFDGTVPEVIAETSEAGGHMHTFRIVFLEAQP